MTFKQFAQKWLREKDQQAENGDLTFGYVSLLRAFYRNYWSDFDLRPITEIRDENIQRLYNDLCKQNLAPSYRALIMTTLKQVLKDAGHLPKWPKIKVPRANTVPQTLTEDQQEVVLAAVPERHRPIVMAFFYHGLRPVELVNLKWTDINVRGQFIRVHTAKGGPTREVLMEDDLAVLLENLSNGTDDSEFVFLTPSGSPYTRFSLYKVVRRALDQTGFSHVSPYQAGRHSAATNYLKRGASTRQVQYLLGHAKITTTERYTHPEGLDQMKLKRR